MRVTEQEAKTKWCPQVRASQGVGDANACNAGTSEGDRVPTYSRCVGSECMMWRWGHEPHRTFWGCPDPNATIEPERPSHVPVSYIWCPCETDAAGWIEPPDSCEARRTGFCGLAGKQ